MHLEKDVISGIIKELYPAGFKVYTTGESNEEEREKFPLLRRFWTKIPLYGNISILTAHGTATFQFPRLRTVFPKVK